MRTIVFIPSLGWRGWLGLIAAFMGGVAVEVFVLSTLGTLIQGAALGAIAMYVSLRGMLLRMIHDHRMTEAPSLEAALRAEPQTDVESTEPSRLRIMRENARWN